jgi:hypothetical protein
MHAIMRDYSGEGAKKLFDVLEKKKAEVKEVIMPIKGFVSYSLVRTARGGFSVTMCQDKAGTDESVRVARDWIANNASDARAAAPTVSHPAPLALAAYTLAGANQARCAEANVHVGQCHSFIAG